MQVTTVKKLVTVSSLRWKCGVTFDVVLTFDFERELFTELCITPLSLTTKSFFVFYCRCNFLRIWLPCKQTSWLIVFWWLIMAGKCRFFSQVLRCTHFPLHTSQIAKSPSNANLKPKNPHCLIKLRKKWISFGEQVTQAINYH